MATIRPIADAPFGVEVLGVDLAQASDALLADLADALYEHRVNMVVSAAAVVTMGWGVGVCACVGGGGGVHP